MDSADVTAAIDAVADAVNADESTWFAIAAGQRLLVAEEWENCSPAADQPRTFGP